jgi:hypothetical protein
VLNKEAYKTVVGDELSFKESLKFYCRKIFEAVSSAFGFTKKQKKEEPAPTPSPHMS